MSWQDHDNEIFSDNRTSNLFPQCKDCKFQDKWCYFKTTCQQYPGKPSSYYDEHPDEADVDEKPEGIEEGTAKCSKYQKMEGDTLAEAAMALNK